MLIVGLHRVSICRVFRKNCQLSPELIYLCDQRCVLLSLRFNAGTALTVTPDHALFADGEFKSAVNVKPGTLL